MLKLINTSRNRYVLPGIADKIFMLISESILQSVYECVNPAMRQQRSTTAETFMDHDIDDPYIATSEIPTLPLRGNRRNHPPEMNGNGTSDFYGITNPYSCTDSIASEHSPNKITRF